ncbi:MAG TPA: Xaa-Pro peptidase family protein [Bacillota bacterium]|nr:Xaa-Pro peptidase family protein [Bacillota bacterium]
MDKPAPEILRSRVSRTKAALDPSLDGLLVTSAAHKGWLSGFTTGVFIAPGGSILLTRHGDFYETSDVDKEECAAEVPHLQVVGYDWRTEKHDERLARLIGEAGCRRVGVEAAQISAERLAALRRSLAPNGVDVVEVGPVVDPLREVKDEWEVTQIRAANRASAEAFTAILPLCRPGATEWAISAALENELRLRGHGSAKLAFQSIVASGPRSSLPHACVTDRAFAAGDLVTFDFGATWNGYCADVTRTICIGRASADQRALHESVVAGLHAGIAAIAGGLGFAPCSEAAFAPIRAAGFGDHLAHGLGHGIGLEIHEDPRLDPKSERTFTPGMIVTVEPGAYIAGWGGVRVEDDVLVTAGGREVLTTCGARELVEV